MSPETTVWLVRHGYVHNPNKIIYGRLPRFRLSERGVEEARAAGRMMSEMTLHAAYSSPLLRARQTAREILAFHPQLRLRQSAAFKRGVHGVRGQTEPGGGQPA